MKYFLIVLMFAICGFANAQRKELTTDTTVAIPPLNFDGNGELTIAASAASSDTDFNFLTGKWKMYHRRLNKRLENCKDWTEFESIDTNYTILSGTADMDIYSTTEMPGMQGKLFEGVTLRLFNPQTRLWSLYWAASNRGVLDPPVVGSFQNNIGHFFTKDTINGKPVIVLFRWDMRNKNKPVWSQAFSADSGKTWEWNWYNVSERIDKFPK
jgi:hypothetical protein